MSSPSNALDAAAPAALEAVLNKVLWALFAAVCVFYAVLAFDYFIAFAGGREGLWLQLFAALVDTEYARGAGSVHIDQHGPYMAGLPFMLMHTTTGALAMALGPFQFMTRWRLRYPQLHRNAGKIYLTAVVMSMIGGLAYLFSTPLTGVFSGPPFGIALIGLDLMVLLTAWLAYDAIRRRAIDRHRSWMAYNFGLLLATPGLRLLWVLFGWLFPGLNQAEANLGIMTFLLPLCVSGMLLWVAAQPARPRAAPARTTPRWSIGLAYGAAVAGAALVAMHHVLRFVLPDDPWALWLPSAQLAQDAAAFERHWPLALAYVLTVTLAMFTGIGAVRRALATGQASTGFMLAAAAAAVAGAALAGLNGANQPGQLTMVFYGWGLCLLWLLALARIGFAARAARMAVVRDWTMYAAALAFLPLSMLPAVPLWSLLESMDVHRATVTAATIAFAGQYLLAHLLVTASWERGSHERAAR